MEEELYFTYNTDDDPCIEDTREQRPLTAEETIVKVIGHYLAALQEILAAEKEQGGLTDYAEGAKSVYVETLQFFQQWEKSGENGLNFNLESVFRVK